MRFTKYFISLIMCVCVLASVFSVSAKNVEYAPYEGYEYDSDSESIAAPTSYVFEKSYDFEDMGLDKALESPSDMYYDGNILYVLDAGNSRILKLDSSLKAVGVIENITSDDGTMFTFVGASGLVVDKNGRYYIADTENKRILIVGEDAKVIKVIEKPETSIVGYDFSFDVTKVLINDEGKLLAIAKSINNGAFVFDADGNFSSFFGRSTVQRTVDIILNFIRKQFMTREQIKKQQNYAPATISNYDIDDNGFIYTVTISGSVQSDNQIRKLNYAGKNIMKSQGIIKSYGDLETSRGGVFTTNNYTSFSDIDIDDNEFIHLLDDGRGKIFQYTQNGQLIAVYGGYGNQVGMFQKPIAIETIGEEVIVLDMTARNISVFKPTDYLKALRAAFLDLDTSDPQKAISLWEEVLSYNSNSQFPYYGLGMAYEKLGDYGKAMDYFKLADTANEYSDAYHEYRKQYMSDNILWLAAIVIAVVVLIVVGVKLAKKKLAAMNNGAFSALENKYTFPLYTLSHPSDGFQQFKYRKELPSYLLSVIIVIAFFLIKVLQFFKTGYIFNGNDPQDYTILSTFIGSVALVILFTVGNWAVCSLLDGNGKMIEIVSVTCYAIIPYLLSQLINVGLSNILTLDEAMTMSIITAIGVIWSAMILLIGLSQVHQYYIGKTIGTMIISLFAMVIIAVIVFLLFSLMQQIIYFVKSIWQELQLR